MKHVYCFGELLSLWCLLEESQVSLYSSVPCLTETSRGAVFFKRESFLWTLAGVVVWGALVFKLDPASACSSWSCLLLIDIKAIP